MKGKHTYSGLQQGAAVVMILMLCWLTVSAPFVFACQQQLQKSESGKYTAMQTADAEEETTTNPYGNNTEEKVPGNGGIAEEYLHETADAALELLRSGSYRIHLDARDYIAFHGELLVPPPNHSC